MLDVTLHKSRVILFQEIAEHRVCMQARGDEETELEFDEEFVAGSDIQHFRRQVNTRTHKTSQKHKFHDLKYEV